MSGKKLKIGIIGVGNRGVAAFAEPISKREDAEVVALADPNQFRMKASSENIVGEQRFYNSDVEMLKSEQLDAVIITSPDCFHAENAVNVLNAGVDVLLDKPLATTVEGCKKILAAAEKSGKSPMIGFNLRHNLVLKRLKEIIDAGTLGRIFLMENREFYNGGRTYMARWNRKYAISGGLWIHKGSHDFDVFNWLLNFPKPEKVTAFAGIDVLNPDNLPFEVEPGKNVGPNCRKCDYKTICKDRYNIEDNPEWSDEAAQEDDYYKDLCIYMSDKDVHDNGIAIVEYENGIKASHMECFITSVDDRRYTIVGTLGQAEVSLTDRTIKICPRWSKETILHNIPEVEGGHGGADPGLIDSFLDVVKGNSSNTSTAEHGMLSTAIGQAAEISRREERLVRMDELL
ncbi:MAG: Gfo/Idh/MocA family oxidoreductase [Victivallaceae bacterium]|nr:Gfo/Idh/MocA family oxidoreductase [Victivallaceae bacterium]